MQINGIGSNDMSAMRAVMDQIKTTVNQAVSQANGDNGSPMGENVEISGPGDLLSKLSSLKSTDPAKFKSVVSEIADKLQKAADDAGTDAAKGKILSDMASKFKNVAAGGDLSQLQPPKGPPPGAQGGMPKAISGYNQNSASNTSSLKTLLNSLLKINDDDEDDSSTSLSSTSSSKTSSTDETTINSISNLLKDALSSILTGSSKTT